MILKNQDIILISNTLQGINRNRNQDDTLILETDKFYLLFLFDGVSSYDKSYETIQIIKNFINKNYFNYFNGEIKLSDLMFHANNYIVEKGTKYGFTTCSSIYISKIKSICYWLNIGDSRIYDFSNQYIEQISTDDNLPGNSSFLTKCLGQNDLTQSDFIQSEINLNYGFLICSDGFYSMMEKELKFYFSKFQFKKPQNIINSINRLQMGINKDDSTYILIKKNGI